MSRSSFKTGTKAIKMSRRAAGILAVVLTFVFLLGSMPIQVSADEGGFTTESYNVMVKTDPDHVFHVTEEISVDFSAPRHGLYRYIPDGGRYYAVENVEVYGHNYQQYSDSDSQGNDYQVLQIGDADRYVTGPQVYQITYDIVGYEDDDETKDMLSLDLLPTDWPTPIQSASVTMTLPQKVDKLTFYGGEYGNSSEGSADSYFRIEEDGQTIKADSRYALPRGVGLTVKADLPQGYWVDPLSRDEDLPAMYGGLGVMGMLMLLLWLFVGRDDPIIPTVEFYPPEDMDPLEIAYIGNDKVESKDISTQFMYFANKGYVKINSPDGKSFTMTRIRDIDMSEDVHSRQIFYSLFNNRDTVELSDLPESFGEVAFGINREVIDSMGSLKQNFSAVSKMGRRLGLLFCLLIPIMAGYFYGYLSFVGFGGLLLGGIIGIVIFLAMSGLLARTDAFRTKKNPVGIAFGLIIIFFAIGAGAFIMSGYPLLAIVFCVSELAAVVATIFVRRRMNNEIYGRVLGFREFIKTAEYDRLKMLADEDPEYYFNILPYAQIFGMTTKWTEKFSNFKIAQPSWYESSYPYDPMFGRYIFIYSGNGITNATSSYAGSMMGDVLGGAMDSGTTGGFGGGGFSGGGFGGGGGGSW